MKKILLALFLFFGLILSSNAQPANDDCSTAQNLGPLPVPAACPSGIGPVVNVAGTTVGALEANPYIFQNGCSGAGGPNMGVPANEVWYSFVATGYQAVITVNSTFPNPNIAMYAGSCAALGGGVGGCAVGTGGTVTLTVEQMVIGTTYYLQVSGNTGQTGTFNMTVRNNKDCADCLLGSNLVVNPLPVNGMYQPGQVVNYCYTINNYSQVNTNWMHGVQITYGAGWAGISGQVPPPAIGGAGAWAWYPSCTSTATGAVFGQGFYIDLDLDGDPGNNFGDNCDPFGTGIPCPGGTSWTFCWNMTVAPGCAPGSDLSVTINTSGDGESGDWSSLGCVDDPASHTSAVGACCPPNMAAVNISCPGMNDGQATATPIGAAGPYNYTWNGPGGYVNTTNGVAGANTITNLSASGVYTVSLTDNNNCLTTATVTVNVGAIGAPAANNTGPYCIGNNINLSVGAGYVDWDWLGPAGYNQPNTQNPVIAGATALMAGVYTVTVTNAGGCTATATTTVVVNALPAPVAANTGPYCPGATINLTCTNTGVDYDWVGPNAYVQNNTQNPNIAGATAAMAGVYTVTVTTAAGCSATATTTVVIAAGAAAGANNTGPYCAGASINLSSPNGAIDYDWIGPNAYVQNNTQNPVIAGSTAAMAGVYTVTVTLAGGCTSTGTTTVVVNPIPVPAANSNSPICAGSNLNLGSNGGVDYDWAGPNAYVQNNTQNPVIAGATVAATGIYTVTVSDAIGCSATATVNVTVNGLPPAVAGNTGPVCDGSNIGLTSNGGNSYTWAGPGAYNNLTQNPVIIGATPAQSGIYTVTVTDVNTCSATATTTLVINALPNVIANSNAPICDGGNIIFNSNGATGYAWAGPNAFVSAAQNPVINNASAINNGVYTVTGTSASGCTSTATVSITTFPNPTAAFIGNPLAGCAPLCVDLTDQSAGNGGVINSWSWNVESQNPAITQNVNYCFNNPGIYDASLTVTTVDGCSSTLTIPNYINVSPNPIASFIYTPQEILELHPDVTFASNSIGATNWLWDFGDGGFSNLENPIHAYQDTGIFCITLLVSNNAGCTDTTVGCLYVQPEYSLYIPNTFTVNGDNLNEMWKLYGRGIKKLEVRIFDRWGEELYFFDDLAKGWPGTRQNGAICKQDVYVFRVEVTDPSNDEHVILGNVNLIR